MKNFTVVFTENDIDVVACYLFDTEEEAIWFLKDRIKTFFWNDVDKNGIASSYDFSEDGSYGVLKNFFPDHTLITEARVFYEKHSEKGDN